MATNNFNADGGEWNTAGNWSLGHVPDETEDCTFTGITTGATPLTITTTNAVCKSADFSTAGAVFTSSGSKMISVYGSLTAKAGMTWSHTGMLRVAYRAPGILTSNGVSFASINSFWISNGGTLTLADDFTCGSKTFYFYSAGTTLNTNNHNITAGLFTDGAAGSKTLNAGTSIFNVSNVYLSYATLTVTGTPTVNITSTSDITANFGSQTWGGTVTVSLTPGETLTLNGTNTFGNFAISWTSDDITSELKLGANQTVSGTFTLTGASVISRPKVFSSAVGTARTITAATTAITGAVDFQDITGAGAGDWDLSGIASGNLGGNSGITFRTPTNYYVDYGTDTATLESNCWATSSGGGAGGFGVFPLPQDTIIIDDNSWDDTGNVFRALDDYRLGEIDASALTEANTIDLQSAFYYGSLILNGPGVTSTASAYNVTLDARVRSEASENLVLNIAGSVGAGNIIIVSYGGIVQLSSNLTHSAAFTLTRGTFDLNGQILTCNDFSSSNTNTRTLEDTAGGGKIIVNGLTGTVFNIATTTNLTVSNAPDIDIGDGTKTLTGNVTFAGGGKTFGDFTVKKHAGNYTCDITGANTFGTFTQETPDATYQYAGVRFTAATTTTVSSFVAVGTADYQLTLSSITAAEHTLSDGAGTNAVQYVTITNSNAGGGATWNALEANGNVDGGGNTGWVFVGASVAPTSVLYGPLTGPFGGPI